MMGLEDVTELTSLRRIRAEPTLNSTLKTASAPMHEICVFAVERGKVEVIDDVFMRFARQERFDGQAHQSFNDKMCIFDF
jgi:hypothetical protein